MRAPRPIPAPVTRPEPHRAPLRAGVGPSHHRRPWMGETLLHWTTRCGDADGARALLPLGADPNATDDAGNTPLHRAAEWGITARGRWLVVLLLAAGADLNATDDAGNTPLESTRYPSSAKIHELLQAALALPAGSSVVVPGTK